MCGNCYLHQKLGLTAFVTFSFYCLYPQECNFSLLYFSVNISYFIFQSLSGCHNGCWSAALSHQTCSLVTCSQIWLLLEPPSFFFFFYLQTTAFSSCLKSFCFFCSFTLLRSRVWLDKEQLIHLQGLLLSLYLSCCSNQYATNLVPRLLLVMWKKCTEASKAHPFHTESSSSLEAYLLVVWADFIRNVKD